MEREKKKKIGRYSIKSTEIIPNCKRCTHLYIYLQHILKILPLKEAHSIGTCKKENYYFLSGISKYVSCYIGKLSLFSQIEWANIFAGNEIPFAFILDL